MRRRIAEADAGMRRCDFAFVTRSSGARAAMTAIGWLSPEGPGHRRKVFASYEEARRWLASGGARESQLDMLHARARSQQSAERTPPR